MNLQYWKSQTLSETKESGSYVAKDASTWVMLPGIWQIRRERHTIVSTQIGKVDFQTHARMDAEDMVTKNKILTIIHNCYETDKLQRKHGLRSY